MEQAVTNNEMSNTNKVTYNASNHSENDERQPEIDEQKML